jgi:hypothetical protein
VRKSRKVQAINNSIDNEIGQRVLIQPDGKILAFGGNAVRYNTDGSLDTSFGNQGTVVTSFKNSNAGEIFDVNSLLALS